MFFQFIFIIQLRLTFLLVIFLANTARYINQPITVADTYLTKFKRSLAHLSQYSFQKQKTHQQMKTADSGHPLKAKKITLNRNSKNSQSMDRRSQCTSISENNESGLCTKPQINYFNFFKTKANKTLQKIESEIKEKLQMEKSEIPQTYIQIAKKLNIKNNENILPQQSKIKPIQNTKPVIQTQKFQDFMETDSVKCGSQYGDHNYDQDLRKVMNLKKGKFDPFNDQQKLLFSKNINLKTINQLKGDSQRNDKVKSMKFRTSNQSKNYSPSKGSLNSMQQIKDSTQNSHRFQNNKKTKTQIKFYLDFYKQEQNKTHFLKYNSDTDNYNELRSSMDQQCAVQQKKSSKLYPEAHHARSKTQQQLISYGNKNDKPIFEKYQNLRNDRTNNLSSKTSCTNRNVKRNKQKQNYEISKINLINLAKQKRNVKVQSQNLQNMKIVDEAYDDRLLLKSQKSPCNSQKKYQFVPIFQNIFKMANSKSGICFSPKNTVNDNLQEKNLRKLIKSRQKDFFQRVKTYGVQTTNFTFEQIKNRLEKLQKSQSMKNNKPSKLINNMKAVNMNRNFIEYSTSQVQEINKKQGDFMVKYNGIKFKAKLMKKSQNQYSKVIKKPTLEGYLKQGLSPKQALRYQY